MFGVQIAFKNFVATKGIWGSPWVGFAHFIRFFSSYQSWRVILNTLAISIYSLIAGFPVPIILALCLNYTQNKTFRKTVQMVTYAPYFISTVVLVGMIMQVLSLRSGAINAIIKSLGGQPINFMGDPDFFRSIYVISGIWQGAGYASIIYLAALSSVNPELHESAVMDGANKFHRLWYIDIPSIMPTTVILLILNCGSILSVGFEKILLLQNPLNLRVSEVISTYVYKVGLASTIPMYSYSTAIGLFTSLIGLILLNIVNRISRNVSDTSLW